MMPSLLLLLLLLLPMARLTLADEADESTSSGRRNVALRPEVFQVVARSWGEYVESHPHGLADPRAKPGAIAAPLSEAEASYHYAAAQAGVVDSARFLTAFGVMPDLVEAGEFVGLDAKLMYAALLRNDETEFRGYFITSSKGKTISAEDAATVLNAAVTMNRLSMVRTVLEVRGARGMKDVDVDVSVRPHGATPLMVASTLNYVEMVKYLLEYGANPNVPHKFAGTTALHFASEMGHTEVIRALCESGRVDPEAKTVTGGTPLHTAADSERPLSIITLLRHCRANPNALLNNDTTPLYLAAQRGHHEAIHALINAGGNRLDIDFVMPPPGEAAKRRAGALTVGRAQDGEEDAVPYDVYRKNVELGNGATALHAAAENGHVGAVRTLVEYGKARSLPSMGGNTPLMSALQHGQAEVTIYFLVLAEKFGHDCLVNHRNPQDGSFALFIAAGNRAFSGDVMEAFLRNPKVELGLRNHRGADALGHALYRGNFLAARKLLDKLNDGKTETRRLDTFAAESFAEGVGMMRGDAESRAELDRFIKEARLDPTSALDWRAVGASAIRARNPEMLEYATRRGPIHFSILLDWATDSGEEILLRAVMKAAPGPPQKQREFEIEAMRRALYRSVIARANVSFTKEEHENARRGVCTLAKMISIAAPQASLIHANENQLNTYHAAVLMYSSGGDGDEAENAAVEMLRCFARRDDPAASQRASKSGYTPLALAAEAKRTKVMSYLLEEIGATRALRERNGKNERPVDVARRVSHQDGVALLESWERRVEEL